MVCQNALPKLNEHCENNEHKNLGDVVRCVGTWEIVVFIVKQAPLWMRMYLKWLRQGWVFHFIVEGDNKLKKKKIQEQFSYYYI